MANPRHPSLEGISLATVHIVDSVTSIGEKTFQGYHSLAVVNMEPRNHGIGQLNRQGVDGRVFCFVGFTRWTVSGIHGL